jgi:hypothetical protein
MLLRGQSSRVLCSCVSPCPSHNPPCAPLRADVRAAERAQVEAERRSKAHAEGAMGTVQGEVVSATLDFLSKELLRLSEHHKIASVVRAAEMARRERCVSFLCVVLL